MQCRTLRETGQTTISLVRAPLIGTDQAKMPLDPGEGRIPQVQVTERPDPEETAITPPDRGLEHITTDQAPHTTEFVTDTTARLAHPHIDPMGMPVMHISITMVMTGDGNWDIGLGGNGYPDIGLL